MVEFLPKRAKTNIEGADFISARNAAGDCTGAEEFGFRRRRKPHNLYYLLFLIFYLQAGNFPKGAPAYVQLQPLHQAPDDDRAGL